jgi:hypothetical protein
MAHQLDAWKELHRFYMYHGYLTKDLAAYLKVSPRTVQRWLKGTTHPKERYSELIEEYLSKNIKIEKPG